MNARMFVSICIAAVMLPAMGQQAPVMKEGQVNEGALIDALTPPEEPIRTRSIRVFRRTPADTVAAKPTKAHLLITFDTNSANLTPSAQQALDVVAQALSSDKLSTFRYAIEGHADPRGMSSANLKLSQARAESVRRYLISSKNIDSARLEAVGKGDQELMNKSDRDAPENRRVTIVHLAN
jgi:outer membrane protein OmpA-like peptidoglycan-associated protein